MKMHFLTSDLPHSIAELPEHVGETVTVGGWVHTHRRLGGIEFLVVRDGYAVVQVLLQNGPPRFTNETVLLVTGKVIAETRAPGGVELHDPVIQVLSHVDEPLPLSLIRPVDQAALATRLDYAPLALRHPETRRWFRVTDHLLATFRDAIRRREFVEVHTPKIIRHASEGGANVFQLDYFGRPAYLAQSPQFYKQIMVGVFGRVFEVGPAFRAEPHDTVRHLNEYTSLDVELGFIQDHRTVMALCQQVLAEMLDRPPQGWTGPWATMPSNPPVISFRQALDLLTAATGEDLRNETDLAPSHERWLGEWARRTHSSDFLFVEGYPAVKRPFYTHPDPEWPAYTRSFDLLFRGQELVTGGQRLHRYHDYLQALRVRGMDPDDFIAYLMAFRFGMPPHGGFAIGLERLVARLAGFSNVRQATLFPRDLSRLAP